MSRVVVVDSDEGVYVYTDDPQVEVVLVDLEVSERENQREGEREKDALSCRHLAVNRHGVEGVVYNVNDDYFFTGSEVGSNTTEMWFALAHRNKEAS